MGFFVLKRRSLTASGSAEVGALQLQRRGKIYKHHYYILTSHLSFFETFDDNACLSDSSSWQHRFSSMYHFRSFACLTFCLLSSAGD